MKRKKKVYVGMSADLIHPGHLNIINRASKLGYLIVGLLSDRAIATYKKKPTMKFNDRLKVVSSIKGVDKVIRQNTLDYTNNLRKIKPKFVVHGDDWKKGIQSKVRAKVIEELKKWNGKLVEFSYTKRISSTKLKKKLNNSIL